MLAAGLSVSAIFYLLTGLALVGVVLTLLVPRAHREDDILAAPAETAMPVETTAAAGSRPISDADAQSRCGSRSAGQDPL